MKIVFLFIAMLTTSLQAVSCDAERELNGSTCMSGHVFVVSEWLPKENCEEELWQQFQHLVDLTLKNENGCVRAHVTRQISHPGAPGKSKYKIVLLQEYLDIDAFNIHCGSDYVARLVKHCIEDKETSLVEDWQCRLFSEGE